MSVKMKPLKTGLSVLICWILSPLSIARSEPPIVIPQEQAFPSYRLYTEDDPWRDLKLSAEQQMGLYLVDPPRRHASEVTQWSNDQLHFHLWRPLTESKRAIWSRAVGWLVFGRVRYSGGAQRLFEDLPTLKRITLSLHEVERPQKTKKGKKAEDLVHTYLTISLKRADFERLDIQQLKRCSNQLDCGDEVRQQLSLLKFNSRYIKGRLR